MAELVTHRCRPGERARPSAAAPAGGLLLAGGRSRRFGSDKRLALHAGRTLFEHCLHKLRRAAGGTVFVAAGPSGYRLPGAGRVVLVRDEVPGAGPLAGIVPALRRARSGLLVMACDVPAVSDSVLEQIVRLGRRLDRPVVPRGPAGWEPLVAYWPRWALTDLEAALREGQRALHVVLARTGAAPVRGVDARRMRNVNRPSDLDGLS